MKYEKGLLFKLMIFKRYGLNIEKYRLNKSVRELYTQKCENAKINLKIYEEIFAFIGEKDIDKDRFYYIYFEMGECLFELERYNEACKYFKIAIDNVITQSYKKNKFKFKSEHYNLFLEDYSKAIDCFLKAGEFDKADYYNNLNMYYRTDYNLSSEEMGDLYASLGAKNQAIKYYDKKISEIDKITITRQYDYDPYTNGYLEEEYNRKVKEKEDMKNGIFEKINSL